MASYNKFQQFPEDLGKGVHQLHAAGHTLKVYLSNAAPSASADAVKADLAEITNENGYTAPVDIQNDYTETGGTGTLSARSSMRSFSTTTRLLLLTLWCAGGIMGLL
jgi:hypothetical protein